MSKLLGLLYREYTRSRMAEMDAAGDFANVWRMANYRRSEDLAQSIAEALKSEQKPTTALLREEGNAAASASASNPQPLRI